MHLWSSIILTRRGTYATRVSTSSFVRVLQLPRWLPSWISRLLTRRLAATETRAIYVSVTDKNNAAITDMQAAEFEVKDGGKRATSSASQEPKIPLRIAMLDGGSGDRRLSARHARFMQKLLGHAEFALYSIVVQPEKIVDFSHDGRELSAGSAARRRGRADRHRAAHGGDTRSDERGSARGSASRHRRHASRR